jgi:hypothetical protein
VWHCGFCACCSWQMVEYGAVVERLLRGKGEHAVPYEPHIDCRGIGPGVLALTCWCLSSRTVAVRTNVYEDKNSKTNGSSRSLKLITLFFYRQFQFYVTWHIRTLVTRGENFINY